MSAAVEFQSGQRGRFVDSSSPSLRSKKWSLKLGYGADADYCVSSGYYGPLQRSAELGVGIGSQGRIQIFALKLDVRIDKFARELDEIQSGLKPIVLRFIEHINMGRRRVVQQFSQFSQIKISRFHLHLPGRNFTSLDKSTTLKDDTIVSQMNSSDENCLKSPLDLFPIEIWETIFTYLDCQTLLNCYRATECWREELERHKVKFLMIEVFPLISRLIERKDVMNMRLVCGGWKASLDEYFQMHHTHFEVVSFIDILCPEKCVLPRTVGFGLNFTKRFGIRHSYHQENQDFMGGNDFIPGVNPFLNRSISYSEGAFMIVPNLELLAEIRTNFRGVLENFGSHLWHCDLTFLLNDCKFGEEDDNDFGAETVYLLACSFLELMPNLKTLKIGCFHSMWFNWEKYFSYLKTFPLEELISSHPLPQLRDVVTLKFETTVNPLDTAVLRRYSHAQKLLVLSNSSHFTEGVEVEPIGWIRLEELKVVLKMKREGNIQLEHHRLKPSSPIRILSIDYHGGGKKDWILLFTFISHFQDTIQHLGLGLFTRYRFSSKERSPVFPPDGIRMKLPFLETLMIRGGKLNINSLDFIGECLSLKEICFAVEITQTVTTEGNASEIQFHGYLHKMYESNIWRILPKLDIFEVRMDPTYSAVSSPDGLFVTTYTYGIYARSAMRKSRRFMVHQHHNFHQHKQSFSPGTRVEHNISYYEDSGHNAILVAQHGPVGPPLPQPPPCSPAPSHFSLTNNAIIPAAHTESHLSVDESLSTPISYHGYPSPGSFTTTQSC
ncbi:unnamed protein product [Orchesella dallaii]|uniref:F-box domain-containing protein n=1 Tax=Orchesella dallaii TaxID=48710 RepID=A0ABP1S1R8_9HEXA